MNNESNLYTSLQKESDTNFSWVSHERHWVPKNRQWYVIYSAFFVTLIAVFAILGEYILIMAIIAFTFLWFIQATIPPEQVVHTINPFGVKTYGKLFKWKNIQHFWFSRKNGVEYLILEIVKESDPDTNFTPRRIILLVENDEMETIFWQLLDKVDYGDRDEIGYNFIAKYLHGEYIDILNFLPEEATSQEEFLLAKSQEE